jgi:hypothetical protein
MKPDKINILGVDYSVTYVDKPSEVDIFHRHSYWGQVDYWTRSIRIFDKDVKDEDLLHSIIHEVLHAVINALKIHQIEDNTDYEDIVDLLALGLADVLVRNSWLKE